MPSVPAFIRRWALVCLPLAYAGLLEAAAPAPAPARIDLDVLASTSLFRSLQRADATAALRSWVGAIGQPRGLAIRGDVAVMDDLADLARRVKQGPPSLLLVDIREYVELSRLGLLEPMFFGNMDAFHLVATPAAADGGLPALRGRALSIYVASRADIGRRWLDLLLREKSLGTTESFFGGVNTVANPSAAVLPVFFGRQSAAIVSRSGLEAMKEMNPQISAKVRVLASSPMLPEGVLCLRRDAPGRDQIYAALRDMHLDPAGKQILLVFHTERLYPFDARVLDQLADLYRRLNIALPGAPEGKR